MTDEPISVVGRASPAPAKSTLIYVDLAKGMGIILVLMFHYGPCTYWPDYWQYLSGIVYKFHMPLFVFLSGYLFTFDARGDGFWSRYVDQLRKKAWRLVIPYFFITLCYVLMKLLGQSFFAYRPVTVDVLVNAFIRPIEGPANLLWFIYMLFTMFLFFPLFQFVCRRNVVVLGLSLVVFVLPGTTLFALDRFVRFFPLFVCGRLARQTGFVEKTPPGIGLAASLACFIVVCAITPDPFLHAGHFLALAGALSGLLFCVFLGILLQRALSFAPIRWLDAVGKQSAIIYLLHQPLVWFCPVVLYQMLHMGSNLMMIGLPLSVALGLIGPMLLDVSVLSRTRILATLFGGTQVAKAPVCN